MRQKNIFMILHMAKLLPINLLQKVKLSQQMFFEVIIVKALISIHEQILAWQTCFTVIEILFVSSFFFFILFYVLYIYILKWMRLDPVILPRDLHVIDVGHSARHPSSKVTSCQSKDNNSSSCHIFTSMVSTTLKSTTNDHYQIYLENIEKIFNF